MNPQRSTTGRLRGAHLAGALFCVCYLTWQAAFAVSCFAVGYGCDLTWTMYSGRDESPTIYIEWRSGQETLLDEDQGVEGVGRVLGGKIDKARFVPPYLCAHLSDARSIRLEYGQSGRQETIPCF